MSNYPPGVTAGHSHFNPPDRSHEHEWRVVGDDEGFILEDGAAIFREECIYAEGRRGDGWECEESRHYRFEYSHLSMLKGRSIHLPTIQNWEYVEDDVHEVVMEIEQAWHSDKRGIEVEVDPDADDGHVSISYMGYTLNYE